MVLMNLFPREQWRNREQTYGHSRGKRMRCMKRVTWKLTLPYIKYIANGNLLYDSENSKRGSVST